MKFYSIVRYLVLGSFLVGGLAAAERPIQGVLLGQGQLETVNFEFMRAFGYSTVVIAPSVDSGGMAAFQASIEKIEEAELELALWIEVGRDPKLAEAHPEWMASIQGHPEWRRFYPDFPKLSKGQTVKVFPWVPIAYEEAFAAQLEKVDRILQRWPGIQTVFLNDLQAAPSACGCGHPLCRWTTDYGPVKTATPLKADFAAKFVDAVRARREGMEVIPVWATECEAGDKPGLCAGVGCYNGACWREWTAQLEPLAESNSRVGALLLAETFQRTDFVDGSEKPWLSEIVQAFQSKPEKSQRKSGGADRLVAVIEGWTPAMMELVPKRLEQLRSAGVPSFVVAHTLIEQGWEPRVIEVP